MLVSMAQFVHDYGVDTVLEFIDFFGSEKATIVVCLGEFGESQLIYKVSWQLCILADDVSCDLLGCLFDYLAIAV